MNNIALQLVDNYIQHVYGTQDIHPTQRQHVTQAFMAGMYEMACEYTKLAAAEGKDIGTARAQMNELHCGIMEYVKSIRPSSN